MKTLVTAFALAISLLLTWAGNPPVARISIANAVKSPSEIFHPYPGFGRVISTNGHDATVIVDGSASLNPNDEVLIYEAVYYDEGVAFNLAGPNYSGIFTFGGVRVGDTENHRYALIVSGSGGESSVEFDFAAITPAEAPYYLLDDLGELEEQPHNIRFRYRPALTTALTSAAERLAQGHLIRGIRSLRHFQKLIRLQHRRLGAPVTAACLQFAETIIETAKIAPTPTP